MQRAFLNGDILAGNLQSFFEGAKQNVSSGYFCGQRDQNIIVVGDGCFQIGHPGLYGTAEFTPDVHFPGGVKAGIVLPEGVIRVQRVGGIFADLGIVGTASSLLQLGIEIADHGP